MNLDQRPFSSLAASVQQAAIDKRAIILWQLPTPQSREDHIAVEQPLEIRVATAQDGWLQAHPVAVTMRTPGDDIDLVLGFLFCEGLISRLADVQHAYECHDTFSQADANVVTVELAPHVKFDAAYLSRYVFTSSSCGVCGKAALELVHRRCNALPAGETHIDAAWLRSLPQHLAARQAAFAQTGGVHAAGLFRVNKNLVRVCEDVGRHNAVDKLVGWLLREERLPAKDSVLMVSGRASFELVQKALMAGIATLVAVGAPSTLAVDLAREYDMTLIGFLRADRFNIYAGAHRLGL